LLNPDDGKLLIAGLKNDALPYIHRNFDELYTIHQMPDRFISSDGEYFNPTEWAPHVPFGSSTSEQVKGRADRAQTGKGGIDLNPNKMDLQLKNAGKAIKFHVDANMFRKLQNTDGFTPIIINVQPVINLRMFLGLN